MHSTSTDICTSCLKKHPPSGYPRKLYEVPVYWSLPDDGALIRCHECEDQIKCSNVYLTQIPCGHREVIHKSCIDEYWLSVATNLGMFKD